MHKSTRVTVGLASASLLLSPALISTPTATAGIDCGRQYWFSVRDKGPQALPFRGVPKYKNGPGPLTMTTNRVEDTSVSASVTAGFETELGAILAKAKMSISVSLQKTNSTGMVNSATLRVPRGKYGHAWYVSWGRKVGFTKHRTLRLVRRDGSQYCLTKTLGSGVAKFPTPEEGWKTWISDH